MDYLNLFISFLTYFGITKETIVPPLLVAGIFYLLIIKSVNKALKDLSQLNLCIVEIQTFLKSKYKNINFGQIINIYGQANSPIVLKDEFKHFITDTKLDKQIEENKPKLLKWLKTTKPATGIDAQQSIINFVESEEVDNYLNLVNYKQNLYLKGKTIIDANGILAVYLFEALIPELALKEA